MARGNGVGCRRSRAWHRAQWQAHVDAWLDSGVSGAAYCRRHGLRPKNLYRWRRVFLTERDEGRGMDGGSASSVSAGSTVECGAALPVLRDRAAQPSPGPFFAELRVASSMSRGSDASGNAVPLVSAGLASGVEVVLAGERRLRIARGFDGATLSEVVRVLEELGAAQAHGC